MGRYCLFVYLSVRVPPPKLFNRVSFEVITAVTIKINVFLDVTSKKFLRYVLPPWKKSKYWKAIIFIQRISAKEVQEEVYGGPLVLSLWELQVVLGLHQNTFNVR
jgi:hypothetical protein